MNLKNGCRHGAVSIFNREELEGGGGREENYYYRLVRAIKQWQDDPGATAEDDLWLAWSFYCP